MEIIQLLPNMADGDAISNHAIELKQLLKGWGHTSEIYALVREGGVSQHCRPIQEFRPKIDSITLYHYSIGCEKVSLLFEKCDGRKILIYHNITPYHFFSKLHAALAKCLKEGRERLGSFRNQVELAIGDSQYNVEELNDLGYRKTITLPIILDFKKFKNIASDENLLKYLGKGWTTFLFTGRVVPSKAQHDAIRCFAEYCKNVNRKSRLILVGGVPYGMYVQELYDLADSLGVRSHVFIPGKVKFSELVTYYRTADLFLCMSDHEGFCVPLLEAMTLDIPILAYSKTGVGCTLDQSGVQVKEKDPKVVAELAHLLITDLKFRGQVLQGQKKRLEAFQSQVVIKQYEDLFIKIENR